MSQATVVAISHACLIIQTSNNFAQRTGDRMLGVQVLMIMGACTT